MGKPQQVEEKRVTVLDCRMGVAVFICFMISTICSNVGFVFPVGDRNLEIIQKMTSCIACLLYCQDTTAISLKVGINRIIITFISMVMDITENNEMVSMGKGDSFEPSFFDVC